MPRPTTLKRPRIVSLNLEEELCILLDKIAAAKGLKSRSAAARFLLEQAIRDEAVKLGLQVVFTTQDDPPHSDNPQVDPLTQLDIEDFEEQLSRFEGELAKLKGDADKVRQLLNDLGYGHGSRPLPQHLEEYVKRLTKRALALKHEWLRLKGWYRKLPPNHDHAARLVAARRALKEIEKLAPQK